MPSASSDSPTFARFFAPLEPSLLQANHQHLCHRLPDLEWIKAGIGRVLGDSRSGCDFVQNQLLRGLFAFSKGHYFESLKSTRRYLHLQSIASHFTQTQAAKCLKSQTLFGSNQIANLYLTDFHVYAGDGHFHAASSHDPRDEKNVKNAIGHLYSLNLRNHFLSHLALGSDGSSKKPHDMGVLKKLDVQTLRQGATKGQKVLYIWDRAGIDFQQWSKWKNTNGIYFLSRTKENMKLSQPALIPYDATDPLNAGILASELVGNSCGTTVRRVTYQLPETGEKISFITNLGPQIPPGIIAQLYFMRWQIEKSFDEIKNKLHELKAWAISPQAKRMQALFITLTYNLAQLLHDDLEKTEGLTDLSVEHKRAARLAALKEKMHQANRPLTSLRETLTKATQRSVKFYRWLRSHLHDPSPWPESYSRLTHLYHHF